MNSLAQILEFPVSASLAASFLLTALVIHIFAGKSKVVKALASVRTSWVMLGVGAVILGIDGTWGLAIHSTLFFAFYLALFLLSLSQVILTAVRNKAKIGFILNHLGIFIIIWAALFGAPDVSKSKIYVDRQSSNNVAMTEEGMAVPLPFSLTLEEFIVDYYEDGVSPRQFTSKLIVDGEKMETSVNHPLSYKGYSLYQMNYDRMGGRYSVLLVVRDPWLPFVYIGMALLAIGSVLLLFGKWKAKVTVPITLLLTVAFTLLTIAKINFGTLMPALRSWWFVPHLFIYMVAYSLMALAVIVWILEAMGKAKKLHGVSDNLVRSSSALLIIGMLTGSVWAREAWGDYWAWDPKENWAAVTWFVALIYLHLNNRRSVMAICVLVLAFLALQITWYGVNYLPSSANSMHTYLEG